LPSRIPFGGRRGSPLSSALPKPRLCRQGDPPRRPSLTALPLSIILRPGCEKKCFATGHFNLQHTEATGHGRQTSCPESGLSLHPAPIKIIVSERHRHHRSAALSPPPKTRPPSMAGGGLLGPNSSSPDKPATSRHQQFNPASPSPACHRIAVGSEDVLIARFLPA
jgi:hypothetical protein